MEIRTPGDDALDILKEFLYLAIFIPEGMEPPERDIIERPELRVYYEDFGEGEADLCLAAYDGETPAGACWSRIMDDYGHIENGVPSLAIAVSPAYRGHGTGTRLLDGILELLKEKGYERVSLSVQKANPAVRLYKRAGFETVCETEDEYIMVHTS